MSKEMYEVIENKKYPAGLTVNERVLKTGQKFSRDEWKWPEENLKKAIKTDRCKKISDGKSESKKSDNKKLENMKKAYDKMNPENEKAVKLLEEIERLES